MLCLINSAINLLLQKMMQNILECVSFYSSVSVHVENSLAVKFASERPFSIGIQMCMYLDIVD